MYEVVLFNVVMREREREREREMNAYLYMNSFKLQYEHFVYFVWQPYKPHLSPPPLSLATSLLFTGFFSKHDTL